MKIFITLLTLITMDTHLLSAQTKRNRGVEAQIRRLNAKEVEALQHDDIQELGRLWSDDFVVTNPLNRLVNKQQVLELISSGTLAFTSYERQIEYLHIYGDTVIVAGNETVVWSGRMPNRGQTSHLRFTSVWIRQGGRWQQVTRHANTIIQ